jgi:phosphoserine phosphatase
LRRYFYNISIKKFNQISTKENLMNLIIQALQDIPAVQLKRLPDLTLASRTEQIAPHAYRLVDAKPHDSIAEYCHEHGLDYGFVRPGQHLSDFGLVVMDMDSTLITIECIDEIADMYHLKPQVSAITEAAMRGGSTLPSLRRRVALLEGWRKARCSGCMTSACSSAPVRKRCWRS